MASSAVDPIEARHLRKRRHAPCADACESQAYRIEIRRLKSVLINEAAELARLMHYDDMTDGIHRHLYSAIQRLKAAGLDGA